MKFNKSDLGMYFALSLVFGGAGMIVGGFVTSRRAKRMREEEVEDPAFESEEEYEYQVYNLDRMAPTEKKEPMIKEDEGYPQELLDFIEEVEPTAMQIELIHKGVVTMDEVRENQERNGPLLEPHQYEKPYRIGIDDGEDDKPDLADLTILPEDMEPISDRWVLSSELPPGRTAKQARYIYYDLSDNSFTLKRGDKHVPQYSLDGVVNDEAWEVILSYLVRGIERMYALDQGTLKLTAFELVPGDDEVEDVGLESS